MGKYVENGKFNSKKWIADNTIPVNERVRFKNRPYDYQLDYVANDLFKKDYKKLNSSQQDDVESKLDDYMDMVESVNERLSVAMKKRMDGLHNIKAMKQIIKGAEVIVNDLVEEEGFDEIDVLEFIMDRIRRGAF